MSATTEATVSTIGEEQLFYLMSRGLSQSEASAMVVYRSRRADRSKTATARRYAIEMNRLIQIQMEGSIG